MDDADGLSVRRTAHDGKEGTIYSHALPGDLELVPCCRIQGLRSLGDATANMVSKPVCHFAPFTNPFDDDSIAVVYERCQAQPVTKT